MPESGKAPEEPAGEVGQPPENARTPDSQSPDAAEAHVLFVDVVGFTKVLMDVQRTRMDRLQEIVQNSREYRRALARQELIPLPTGDGMALVFLRDTAAPVRCALEIAEGLKAHPEVPLRMGVNTGPVFRRKDIAGNDNVTGAGINYAQRAMDRGGAGHILLTNQTADFLSHLEAWSADIHDLGDYKIKHGKKIHLYNLYRDGLGNPKAPPRHNLIFGIVCFLILAIAVFGSLWYIKLRPAATVASQPSTTAQAPVRVLTNDNIIEMVQAQMAPSDIISHIRSTKTNFNFSTSELIRLSKAGVPEIVMNTMRDPKDTSALVPSKPVVPGEALPPGKSGSGEPVMSSVDDGLPFGITLDQDVPADAALGEPLRFWATDGLNVGDAVVIAKGAAVTGAIASEPGKKKFLGMGGKATFRLEKVDAIDGQKINIRAGAKRRADGLTTRSLDSRKGSKSKKLAAARGTQYVGYIDGQQTVSVRK